MTQRPIRFRAWDGREMTENAFYVERRHTGIGVIVVDGSTQVYMQFTGLLDKNGKEIYEGDVVRILYTDWGSQQPNEEGKYLLSLEDYMKSISDRALVVYREDRFCLRFQNKYGEDFDRLEPGTHGEREVIGNIYENPELLKA